MSKVVNSSGMKITGEHTLQAHRALARAQGLRACKELFQRDTITCVPASWAQLHHKAAFITAVPYGERGAKRGEFRLYYFQGVFYVDEVVC